MKSDDTIQLAHGGGGRLTRDWVHGAILSRFGEGPLRGLPDAATVHATGPMLFTTDSFVVQPIEFPGGNIGHLAVHGTVNDIAVSGGLPRWLSLALIIEEGLPLETLNRVLDSVRDAAATCAVTVVTGDTKVVGRGQADGLYINTSGIGEAIPGFSLSPAGIKPGDVLVTSGTLADHGMAVLTCRQGIDIAGGPLSDSAPVHRLVQALTPLASQIAFMRDPTRGGAAAVLNEAVEDSPLDLLLSEASIPLTAGVRAIAEILGIDPLHVASEGRVLLFCRPTATAGVLAAWQAMPDGRHAAVIGRVADGKGRVILETVSGGRRLVDLPRGELLPRIC